MLFRCVYVSMFGYSHADITHEVNKPFEVVKIEISNKLKSENILSLKEPNVSIYCNHPGITTKLNGELVVIDEENAVTNLSLLINDQKLLISNEVNYKLKQHVPGEIKLDIGCLFLFGSQYEKIHSSLQYAAFLRGEI